MVGDGEHRLSPQLATSEGALFLNKKSMPASGVEMLALMKASAAQGFKDTCSRNAMPCRFPGAETSALS